MINLIDLTDKKIVVTGASSGIGKQTAITLSQIGAKLILVARREEKLQEVIQQLEGDGHSYYCADLSVVNDIEDLVKRIVAEQGKLDGMVYCAGITMNVPLAQLKPEKLQTLFDINFFAFTEFVRQVTKKNRFNEGMRIVGISSTASFIGNKAHEAYSASKAAMNGIIRCMAKELADKGICINAIAPGMVATEMYEEYLLSNGGEESEANQRLRKRQYLGIGKTTDIANAIAFMLSSASRFISGITLPVDGGSTSC